MTLDETIEYEKESLRHCKRMLEEIYEDNLENKILKFEVKQHEHLAELLEDYKHVKQWKSDVMDSFCKYDCNSIEEVYKSHVARILSVNCSIGIKLLFNTLSFHLPCCSAT